MPNFCTTIFFRNLIETAHAEPAFQITFKTPCYMKSIFLLSLIALYTQPHAGFHAVPFIDPTGTYLLKGEVKRNNITGHSGELRVQLLDSQTVAFCLYISNGYPEYTSGAIMDTLHYEENMIRYRPKHDTTCSLILTFSFRSVDIMKVFTDLNAGCGLAPGLAVAGTFQKISSEKPIIQDLSRRGRVTGRVPKKPNSIS